MVYTPERRSRPGRQDTKGIHMFLPFCPPPPSPLVHLSLALSTVSRATLFCGSRGGKIQPTKKPANGDQSSRTIYVPLTRLRSDSREEDAKNLGQSCKTWRMNFQSIPIKIKLLPSFYQSTGSKVESEEARIERRGGGDTYTMLMHKHQRASIKSGKLSALIRANRERGLRDALFYIIYKHTCRSTSCATQDSRSSR